MTTSPIHNLAAELTLADDIKKPWPKNELLFTLGFPASARNTLCSWYWREKETVALEEIFNLLISGEEDPRPGYLIMPLLGHRNVGKKGLLQIVDRMSQMDFGPTSNIDWKEKYQRFLDAHRAKGAGGYNWSFPITEKGKSMARFKAGGIYPPR